MSDYFYTDSTGNIQGPFTADEFEQRISSGEIRSTAECKHGNQSGSALELVGQSKFAMLTEDLPPEPKPVEIPRKRKLEQEGRVVSFLLVGIGVLMFAFWSIPWGIITAALGAIVYFVSQS